jgi:hypothetical protein
MPSKRKQAAKAKAEEERLPAQRAELPQRVHTRSPRLKAASASPA